MNKTLFGLNQSPWTERARWALDHHRIGYDYHEHVPMLGEVLLRRKARVKKASVPLFIDDDGDGGAHHVVMGSLAIAKRAEKTKGEDTAPLFANDPQRQKDIEHWADVAERISQVGRVWVLKRLLASRGAQAEALPPFIPGVMRGLMAPTSGMAIRFLAKKYNVSSDVEQAVDQTMRPLFEEMQKALDGGKKQYLVGDALSFGDIAMATTMQAIRPREGSDLGPATSEAWTNDALAADFGDLLAWRDALYAKHRSVS